MSYGRVTEGTERAGDARGHFCKLAKHLYLRLISSEDKEFARLVDVLFLHGFLPSRTEF